MADITSDIVVPKRCLNTTLRFKKWYICLTMINIFKRHLSNSNKY